VLVKLIRLDHAYRDACHSLCLRWPRRAGAALFLGLTFLIPFIPSGMASNLETEIGVHSPAKSACMLATKDIQIFEIAEAIKWFPDRMCDAGVWVSNIFGVWMHDQIVLVDLQSAVVRRTGNRFIVGDPNSYFFEQRERTPIISELWNEYHIPFVVSGIGGWAANNYGALQISRSAFAAAQGGPADNHQAICKINQSDIRGSDVAKQIRKGADVVIFGGTCVFFIGLGLLFLHEYRETVPNAARDISCAILIAFWMFAMVYWPAILLIAHSAGWWGLAP
jgi:hypothetical protein